jgi:hypothetical protein
VSRWAICCAVHFDAVVRGFRTAANFIAIAYLRLGKLTHLPTSPFVPAMPNSAGVTIHRA